MRARLLALHVLMSLIDIVKKCHSDCTVESRLDTFSPLDERIIKESNLIPSYYLELRRTIFDLIGSPNERILMANFRSNYTEILVCCADFL